MLLLFVFGLKADGQTATTTTVTSDNNSVCENSNVVFTATVNPNSVSAGSVEFFEDGNSIGNATLAVIQQH